MNKCTQCHANDAHDWDAPDGTTLRLCNDCAIAVGFCVGCGGYIAGSEFEERHGLPGLCVDCLDDLRAETGEYDDWQDQWTHGEGWEY